MKTFSEAVSTVFVKADSLEEAQKHAENLYVKYPFDLDIRENRLLQEAFEKAASITMALTVAEGKPTRALKSVLADFFAIGLIVGIEMEKQDAAE